MHGVIKIHHKRTLAVVILGWFAFLVLAGCLGQPLDGAAPLGETAGLAGRFAAELDPETDGVLWIEAPVPPAGSWGNVTVTTTHEATDGALPLETLTGIVGSMSPRRPGDFITFLATIARPDRPAMDYVAATVMGNRVNTGVPGLDGVVKQTLADAGGGARRVSTWEMHIEGSRDLRSDYGLLPNDPLVFHIVVSWVPSDPARLLASVVIEWNGVPMTMGIGSHEAVHLVHPSDMGRDLSVVGGPVQAAEASEVQINLGGGLHPTLAFYVPPVWLTDQSDDAYLGGAYVQPPGQGRQYLDKSEAATVYWVEQPGTWSFGQDRVLQIDGWDRAAVIAVDLPARTDPPRV